MAHNLRSERTSPRYLGPRDHLQTAPSSAVKPPKRRVWHTFVELFSTRRKREHRRSERRRAFQRSTTHPQGFVLPPYAFQSMGYPPPPHIPYAYGVPPPPPMAYMPPPPPRTHDVNDRTFMDPEFYNLHPEYDMRSEVSHQSGSTRPGNSRNYRRDNHNQPPFAFSSASPQEIEEYERELPPAPRRRRSMDELKRINDDEEEEDEEDETLTSPIKGFDSFMMY